MSEHISYDQENNRYNITSAHTGLCISVSPESLGRARYQKARENKMTNEQARQYGAGFTVTDGLGLQGTFSPDNLIGQTLVGTFANTPSTPKTMTRLTSYNDWTILLEGDKLVAVNSNGQTVRAVGRLLSAGGRAWMHVNGQLWSGELEHHETEKEVRENEKKAAAEKVLAKYNKKLQRVEAAHQKLLDGQREALRSL